MITVKFLKNHRVFKAGEVIKLDRLVNILVGDQGVGKSTLLELITDKVMHKQNKFSGIAEVTLEHEVTAFSHDYEKGNVRGGAAFGMGGIDDMGLELRMLSASHGQSVALATRYLMDQMIASTKNGGRGMLLLDEPDSGLSIRSSNALGKVLHFVGTKNHFVVASIHNFVTMTVADMFVYDVELRKYTTPSDFLERMLSKG